MYGNDGSQNKKKGIVPVYMHIHIICVDESVCVRLSLPDTCLFSPLFFLFRNLLVHRRLGYGRAFASTHCTGSISHVGRKTMVSVIKTHTYRRGESIYAYFIYLVHALP